MVYYIKCNLVANANYLQIEKTIQDNKKKEERDYV